MIREAPDPRKLPFPREVLIDAARMRARGVSWALIAEKTPYSEGDFVAFALDQPEIWSPLYARAEKLRLQEAEGQGLAHLTALLKGNDETAAERAAREALTHRRHVQRSRGDMYRKSREARSGTCPPTAEQNGERWFAEDPAPEDLRRPIIYAANRVAHGEPYVSIAREVGHDADEIARWAFIYPRTWDRVYPQARLTAAQFGAALAINRLLDFAAGPDAALAARAARTLLIHRRHMHWARLNQPPRHQEHQEEPESWSAAEVEASAQEQLREGSSNLVPWCLGGEKKSPPWCLGGERGWRSRDGPGE